MDQRRQEEDEPLTPSGRNSNVFGDEYEVVDVDVSDGFMPPRAASNDGREDEDEIYSAAAYYAANPVMSFSPDPQDRRSSTQKPRHHDNPFTSVEDAETPLSRTPSIASSAQYAPGLPRRSISSATSYQYASTNSPRSGAAGPSHPYTMYPQGTVARTSSVATSTQPGRHSSLRAGPAHPYGMYTQGIVDDEDEDDDEETAINPLPVGFGLNQTYRRVRGPEGEEQDIIGEYGHAEQLPPYSRYPDEGPEKTPLLAVPEGLHTRAPIEGTDPGMPLMHQRMSRQSMTDASNLEQERLLPADQADVPSLTEASSLGKKSWKEKSWKERRRTRLCGVPFGWILVSLCVLGFVFAVLVGSLVGYLAGKKDRGVASAQSAMATTTTSLYDASVIATPTNAPATGTFAITLGTPQATQADCLVNSNQRVAWDCNLVGRPAVAMTVGLPAQAVPTMGARIYYAADDDTNITYGAQIQEVQSQFSTLIPVQDNDDPGLGPAFFFQSVYDKIVVLPEESFSVSRSKRQGYTWPNWDAWRTRKAYSKALPGEKPWFCVFNNTAIEGFLYVQRPAWHNTSRTSTSAAWPSMTAAPTSYSAPSQQAWQAYRSSVESARASMTAGVKARGNQHFDDNLWSSLPSYPFLVKLEERRLPNNTVSAYCQQYKVLDNGQYNIYTDSQGQPVKLYLEEHDPAWSISVKSGGASTAYKRANMPGGCHCQWMHGAPP